MYAIYYDYHYHHHFNHRHRHCYIIIIVISSYHDYLFHQNESHPYLHEKDLRDYCRLHGIAFQVTRSQINISIINPYH